VPATVVADEGRLKQVLINLAGNAIKFTARGHVRMQVQRLARQGSDRVSLRFSVEDTGCGIPLREQDRIFQPFEQSGDYRERATGTGLGLAISKAIVSLMGGDILLRSEVNQGSAFWFDLDLPVEGEGATPVSNDFERITGYRGERRLVLVADDITPNILLVSEVLSVTGFDIVTASDGVEAVEQARRHGPDLVIMDVLMPRMTGLDAIRVLREDPQLATVPVVAVSASSFELDRRRALEAGANEFLPKPLDFELLFQALGKLLRLTWTLKA
jgi:CheY-like chemotaxis protein